ncbi:hypothetical protein L3X38_042442 [Prunus dulcis]|uniref:Reverse transcriptase Ty1/copia-type domain-containing protein n=1 Tax=Prunus dulcis TaxID=3755 RepID=A0AAD4YLZ5_PRUDU|nr:hypothetical protein L3X38_042442 [Prunus dulcis]
MQEEFNALQLTGTWSLTPSCPQQNLVGCKWVFRNKRKLDGSVDRYKARLVAKVVYMEQPPGFVDSFKPTHVCQLHRSLYGLKQAQRAWYEKLHSTLKDLGPLHYFLGLEVQRSSTGLFLSQAKYATDLLTKVHMTGAKPCATPVGSVKLDHSGDLLRNLAEY